MPNIRGQMARAEKTSDRVKPRRASVKPAEPGAPAVGRKEISPEVAKGSVRIYGRYRGSQATKTEAERNLSFIIFYTCDSVDTELVRLHAIRRGLPVSFVDEIVQSGAIMRIPTEAGQGYRFGVGHRSDLKPATIPI